MEELQHKNTEGTITAERTELQQLVGEAEQLMVENAHRLQNGVPLLPRSNATATVDCDLVNKLRDELP
jgi:hypothetical protein